MISNRQRRWTLASPLHLKLHALVIESDANCPPRKLGQHHLSSRAPRGICCLRPEGVFTREVGCLPKESPWAEHNENAATRQRAVSTVPHRSACCVSSYRRRARSACLSAAFPPSLRPTPPSNFSISNRHSPELETRSNPYKTKAGDAL